MSEENKKQENESGQQEDSKNKGGRPPVWATPEELNLDIEYYKLYCKENPEEIPDIESFCYFVMQQKNRNTFSRETFRLYEQKEGFGILIERIKCFMAYRKKQLAMQGKIPPAIFCFDFKNNHDYKDKTDQSVELGGTLDVKTTLVKFV